MVITINSSIRQGSLETKENKDNAVSEQNIRDILQNLLNRDNCADEGNLTITEGGIEIERINPLTLHSFLLELEKLGQTFEMKKKLTINLI